MVQPITRSTLATHIVEKRSGHKYDYGHVLVLSGPAGQTGAARMAARAALRCGAGLVTIGAQPDALSEIAAHTTAVMQRALPDVSALKDLLEDARLNTLVVGPGFGLSGDRAEWVDAVLQAKRATVLDADALTLMAEHREMREALHDKCVLTPHWGEFARLCPDLAAGLAEAGPQDADTLRAEAVCAAAARLGAIVLLKGEQTVVAAPDDQVSEHLARGERAAPWLATAGSGDVLAGFIAGCAARGGDLLAATALGVWLHVEAARTFGPGLIAEDLPEQLPAVFRSLFS